MYYRAVRRVKRRQIHAQRGSAVVINVKQLYPSDIFVGQDTYGWPKKQKSKRPKPWFQGARTAFATFIPLAVTVPNILGLTEPQITIALGTGLIGRLQGLVFSNVYPVNTATSQSLAAGSIVTPGSRVSYTLSLGPGTVVPNVIGLSQSAAIATILGAGFSTPVIQIAFSPGVLPGYVWCQAPDAGTLQAASSPVTIDVQPGYGVIPPPADTAGIALNAQMITATSVVGNSSPAALTANMQLLNQLQVQLVDHYMVTGWLNAATILAAYPAAPNDKVGQALTARVAFLQNLVNNAPAMPPGNANGYGGAGWTTLAVSYQQMLYAKQIELVEHIMDSPLGTSAMTMLIQMTGFQSFPFEYKFNSVGFTDAWIDD